MQNIIRDGSKSDHRISDSSKCIASYIKLRIYYIFIIYDNDFLGNF